jgi:hypothetical protein
MHRMSRVAPKPTVVNGRYRAFRYVQRMAEHVMHVGLAGTYSFNTSCLRRIAFN